ncbi:hypothetical protein [Desulfocastanea catecholica]
MSKKLINVVLIAISAAVLLTGVFMTAPMPEPMIMMFFGTGLIGVAGVFKTVTS